MIPRSLAGSQSRDVSGGCPGTSLFARLLAPLGVVYRWRAAMAIDLDCLSEEPRFSDGYATVSWMEFLQSGISVSNRDGQDRQDDQEGRGDLGLPASPRLRVSASADPVHPYESSGTPASTSALLNRVCRIDQRSYEGTIDAALYGRYFRTAEGARRLWEEALAGRFGRFDGHRSLLLLRDGEPRGQVMACLRTAREGFIGDLAVLPEDRGGTGRALLLDCLWRYRRAGIQTVSLAVTLENERAFRLYQSLGFTVRYRFPVMSLCYGARR